MSPKLLYYQDSKLGKYLEQNEKMKIIYQAQKKKKKI